MTLAGWRSARRGAEAEGDPLPGGEERVRGGQVEDDSAHGLDDTGTDLDQALPKSLDLSARAGSSGGTESQLLHEVRLR